MLSISLGDILKTLDQFKEWPRIKATPARVDELEKRVAALEARLAAPQVVAEPCPYCSGPLKLVSEAPAQHFGVFGVKERTYRCEPCGQSISRQYDPRKA